MDLQGQPIPPGYRSTKVTADPLADCQPVREPSGPVLDDSLAAESVKRGGPYSENRGAQPLGVSSDPSSILNTDTSATTRLPTSSELLKFTQERYPEALGGQGDFPGAHLPESGYVGGPSAAKKDLGLQQGEYPASENLSQTTPASGSGYQNQYGSGQQQTTSSRGTSNTSGFPEDPKYNASFNSTIGSEDDPGRLAEDQFQHRNAKSALDSGRPAGKEVGDQHWYQPLERDQRA